MSIILRWVRNALIGGACLLILCAFTLLLHTQLGATQLIASTVPIAIGDGNELKWATVLLVLAMILLIIAHNVHTWALPRKVPRRRIVVAWEPRTPRQPRR